GLRGLAALRSILANIGVVVIPTQVAISRANEAFDADGNLKDAQQQLQIHNLGIEVSSFARRLGR
ncbi:MAG: NADPH-dependent FMN reductase, partial [Burkholderiales bacterium]